VRVAAGHRKVASDSPSPSLHGIIRSREGELYSTKRESFEALLADEGETLRGFATKVFGPDRFAVTTVSKLVLVTELLYDMLSEASWRLIRDRLREHPFLTDRRHTEEYAFDVALGWLEEELVIARLSERLKGKATIDRIGIYRAREFLSLNIRATADISVRSASRRLLIDLFVDQKGTWRRNHGMDLKQGKLRHFARGKLDFVLGLDLVARRFYLVGATSAQGAPIFANAAIGGTETARIALGRAMTLDAMAKAIEDALNRSPKWKE